MELHLLEMWHNMNPIVKSAVIVLTIQGVWCITVAIDRLLMLFMSKRRSRAFASAVAEPMETGNADAVVEIADGAKKRSHLARIIHEGVLTFRRHLDLGLSRNESAEYTKRSLERTGEDLSGNLNKGMVVLATTGSTAPFVGLLGTVFGILAAFKVIGQEGGGGLSVIGPLIGEALYITGYGLMVAIPAVMLFNWLNGLISKYEAGLANAGSELVDQLEAGALGGREVLEAVEPRVNGAERQQQFAPSPAE